jgi:hypothetical protein
MDIRACVAGVGLLLGSTAPPGHAGDTRAIELRRLLEPTPAELRSEASGRVYIYEGLRESDIAQAMDDAFDRLDSMMFIRVQRARPPEPVDDPEGRSAEEPTYYTVDDGC